MKKIAVILKNPKRRELPAPQDPHVETPGSIRRQEKQEHVGKSLYLGFCNKKQVREEKQV